MEIGLCMVVKDEAKQIGDCLEPILDLFHQVAIVDTGSTDGTPEVLRTRLGIAPVFVSLDDRRCRCLSEPRREAMNRLSTPWIFLLDADERLPRSTLERLRERRDDRTFAGYFGRWINYLDGAPPFDDYKLFLFRNGLRTVGLVHDVVQHDIRAKGLQGAWLNELIVSHFPDASRRDANIASYRERLTCAIGREPQFVRYHWFMGYMDFLAGRFDDAVVSLARATRTHSRDFPVESLNSAMVLADIFARNGDRPRLGETLDSADVFFASVSDDFEVAVNTRLGPWLAAARERFRAGRLDDIRAYRFAC
jgi:glycosyltransferase involved in cell wall biosynthesis